MKIWHLFLITTYCVCAFSFNANAQSLRENGSRSFKAPVQRVEALAYVAGDDSIWAVNDSNLTFGGVDRLKITGIQSERRNSLFSTVPGLTQKHYQEIETMASDGAGTLYLVNTVNDLSQCPNDDIATIYKLTRATPKGSFVISDWHALPSGDDCHGSPASRYNGLVIIDGAFYFSTGREIHLYDYAKKEFVNPGSPVIDHPFSTIRDMAYDGTALWVLSYGRLGQKLVKYDWKTKVLLATYALNELSVQFTAPRGLAVHGNEIFIGDNASTSPNVYIFEEPTS